MGSPLTRTIDLLLFEKRNVSAPRPYGPRFCSKKRGGVGANSSPKPESATGRHYLDYENLSLNTLHNFCIQSNSENCFNAYLLSENIPLYFTWKTQHFFVFHFVPTPVIYFSTHLCPLICRFADLKVDKNKNGL